MRLSEFLGKGVSDRIAEATAAFGCAHLELAASISLFLPKRQAALFRDGGAAGQDYLYAVGRETRYAVHPDTVWVDETYVTDLVAFLSALWGGDAALALFVHLEDALQAAGDGGRILVVDHEAGGSFEIDMDV